MRGRTFFSKEGLSFTFTIHLTQIENCQRIFVHTLFLMHTPNFKSRRKFASKQSQYLLTKKYLFYFFLQFMKNNVIMFHYCDFLPCQQQTPLRIFNSIIGCYWGFLRAWPLLMVRQKENRFFFKAENRLGSVSIKQNPLAKDTLIIYDYLATIEMIIFVILTRVMGLVQKWQWLQTDYSFCGIAQKWLFFQLQSSLNNKLVCKTEKLTQQFTNESEQMAQFWLINKKNVLSHKV